MERLHNHQDKSPKKTSTDMTHAQLAAAPHKHPHDGLKPFLDRFHSRSGHCRPVGLSPPAATIVDFLRAVKQRFPKHGEATDRKNVNI